MPTINENIAKNIITLRKQNKWTQQDLANKLNYSDKTISKWERGDSTPDIEMLCKVAEIFNVNVDYLTKEHTEMEYEKLQNGSQMFVRNLLILLMMCIAVYIIATIVFVYPVLLNPSNAKKFWIAYLYALPVCAVICNYYAKKMNIWLMRLITCSVFVWTLIASSYCLALILGYKMFWLLFLIGIPIQSAICLYFFWRRTF